MVRGPAGGFSLDLDSTVFPRCGHQAGAAKGYNPRRPGRQSHHPLLAVLAEAPLGLHGWLRSGNTGAARGVAGTRGVEGTRFSPTTMPAQSLDENARHIGSWSCFG